jgi:hypothetical protein
MSPIDEPASFEPKPSATEARKSKAASSAPEQPTSPDLVAFTVDAANGRIVSVERVDSAGVRQELSEDERARLTKHDSKATLDRVIELAFEAGIACVLGEEADEAERPESQEDAELSRLLLRSLLENSTARQLMHRDVLSRAIVGTLIQQAAGDRPPAH